jgi:hypothetical protein
MSPVAGLPKGLRRGVPVCLAWAVVLFGLVAGPTFAVAQPSSEVPPPVDLPLETEFRLLPAGQQPLLLSHTFVEPGSVRLFVEGTLWDAGTDYNLRSRSGIIVPLREWKRPAASADSSAVSGGGVLVMVTYRFLPVPVEPRRDLRPVASAPDQDRGADAAPLFTAPSKQPAWSAGDLQVNGSKTVQVASGSRRELTVDQNLRLSIVGQLTRDISVRAYLSDDNLPVVPEGNTEELRDIDKVLVEMRAPDWEATMGDFVANRGGSVFGNYRRKLQGFTVKATPGRTRLDVVAGSPRGIYRTLQIRGEETNHGPYYLGGSAGAGNLFIIAGSERVTLDGLLLTRGADRDYVIDYVAGTVTFTYRKLITAESTIVVEFEEGEGPYGRTVLGAGGGLDFDLPLSAIPASFDVQVIREKDDPGRLRTGELGEDDEMILGEAGDDPTKAVAGGVNPVDPGTGDYDQGLDGTKTIYVYNPAGGDFDVAFYYVGFEAGDYALESLTATGDRIFIHLGDGQGNYRIGRPLPMPESNSVLTAKLSLGDTSGVFVRGEWNAGDNDKNVLSGIDNDDNQGEAAHVAGGMLGRDVGIGTLDLTGFWQDKAAEFVPFQVHKTVFDYDPWGLADRARQPGFLDEADREAGAQAVWSVGTGSSRLRIKGNLGRLRHGASLEADQASAAGDWSFLGGRGTHVFQDARAEDTVDPLDSRRTLRNHQVSWVVGPVVPSATYRFRRWEDGASGAGSAAGFRHEEYGYGLGSAPGKGLAWQADFQRGLADSLYAGSWVLERDTRTTKGSLTTGQFGGMRLVGEATLREIEQPGAPEQTTRLGRLDLSGAWNRSASDWSLGYKVDNSRTEVLDRQIVFVGEGQGDYDQDGNYLGQGQGDYDLVFAGTDSLVATTSVGADLHWRQGFRWLGADRWYGAWSSLALVSLTSSSTTDDVGGLLRLDPDVLFDEEHTVLGDLTYTQEITLLQHLRTIDLRGKFDFRQIQDRRFADHPEDRLRRNWQATGTVNVSARSSVKLRWQRQDENRFTEEAASSSRSSYVSLTRRYEGTYTYNPTTDLRLSMQGEFVDRADEVTGVTQDEYAVKPSVRGRYRRVWTLQGDLRVSEVTSDEPAGAVRPWFYSFPGRNIESSLRLAWDPSEFLAVSLTWFTRKKEEGRWQHDLRLETTARF